MTVRRRGANALPLLRLALWIAVPGVVAWVAWTHRESLAGALRLMRHAELRWLAGGAVAAATLYLCRAFVYRVPLRLLGYSAGLAFLWSAAMTTSALQQVLPAGGAVGYAFLTYAMHQRGVPAGRASLIALVDTLSYAFAVATLVIGSLVWLGVTGHLHLEAFRSLFLAGVVILAIGVWIYWLQRERRRFVPVVLRIGRRIVTSLGRRWREEPVRDFLDEFYRGKGLIRRRPRAFIGMIGLQYVAVACDAATLYAAFVALGQWPRPSIVFLGFVVAMGGAAAISVPGGGGTFETLMSAFFVSEGIPAADAIAATLLFRVITFWLPVAVAGLVLLRLRRRRHEIRRDAEAA
jgi:hypothetical protein